MKYFWLALISLLFCADKSFAFQIPPCTGTTVDVANLFDNSGTDPRKPALIELEFVKVLLENEANGGRVAYCLSDARMSNGRNGLSFGFFQYDLAQNDAARFLLAKILERIVGFQDSSISPSDIQTIKKGRLSQVAPVLRASNDLRLRDLIERVNKSLATKLGRDEINADFILNIRRTLDDNSKLINNIDDKAGSRSLLVSNNAARLLLLDYENFFGSITLQSKFLSYLSGRPTALKSGTIIVTAPASTMDIANFYLSGKQGSGPASDERAECLRRINNVVRFYEETEGALNLNERDKVFLSQRLKPMLDDSTNKYIQKKRKSHEYDALIKLIDRASGVEG